MDLKSYLNNRRNFSAEVNEYPASSSSTLGRPQAQHVTEVHSPVILDSDDEPLVANKKNEGETKSATEPCIGQELHPVALMPGWGSDMQHACLSSTGS